MHFNPNGWSYNEHTQEYVNSKTGERVDARNQEEALAYMGVPYYQTNSKEQAVDISNLLADKIDPNKFYKALTKEIEKQNILMGMAYFDYLTSTINGHEAGGMSFDGDPKKGKMSTALSFALVASAADGPLPFGEAVGIAAVGATAIYLLLTPELNDCYYPGPFYTDRPKNYIPPPVPAMNNKNYFPDGNGNDYAKWAIYIGGGATLARRIYEGFSIDSTRRFNPQDNTYFAPFVTPIPDPSKGY